MTAKDVENLEKVIRSGVDWCALVSLAFYHRVFALVYRNLKQHQPVGVPREVEERLADYFQDNQRRMMEMIAELLCLMEAFEQKGIPVIPLKGPALAATVYGNVALRPAGDLDLLVRRDDIPAALDVLRAAGFSVILHEPGAIATAAQEAAISRFLYHYILFDEERALVVELHFSLSPKKMPFPADPDALIARSATSAIGGRKIRTLNPEDNFLFLCVHGGKHAWSRLEWIVGIRELLRQIDPLDEEKLWEAAEKRNAGLPLLLGLLLVNDLLDPNLAPALTRRARENSVIRKLCQEVRQNLDQGELIPNAQMRFQLAFCRTLGARLRWLFYSGLQPGHADIRYADVSLLPLYYLIRPVRLALKLVEQTFRRKETATEA